jgi:hypothetical protein
MSHKHTARGDIKTTSKCFLTQFTGQLSPQYRLKCAATCFYAWSAFGKFSPKCFSQSISALTREKQSDGIFAEGAPKKRWLKFHIVLISDNYKVLPLFEMG